MVVEGTLGKNVLSPGAINSNQEIRAGSSMDHLLTDAPGLQSNTIVQTVQPALSPNYNREKAAKSIVTLENSRNNDLLDPTI